MVKLMGHVAMGLLLTVPAWFVWRRTVSLTFIGLALATVMLPDVDLVLSRLLPSVTHHGVTHTLVFVLGAAVVCGMAVATVLWPRLETRVDTRGESPTEPQVFLFATAATAAGGVSHVFADMLSAPDIAQPIEPLWPLVTEPISFDVIYYSSLRWNLGLLVAAVTAHLLVIVTDQLLFGAGTSG